MRQVITIEVCGKELEAEVEFDFTPKVPARTSGLPENCWPEEPETWEIYGLFLKDDSGVFCIGVSGLILYIEDELIELLRDTL